MGADGRHAGIRTPVTVTEMGERLLHFALVKPEPVVCGAAVHQYRWLAGLVPSQFDLVHLFAAAGAGIGFFPPVVSHGGRGGKIRDGGCFALGCLGQQAELVMVEPQAVALQAVIQFHPVPLHHDHRLFADGAIHKKTAPGHSRMESL